MATNPHPRPEPAAPDAAPTQSVAPEFSRRRAERPAEVDPLPAEQNLITADMVATSTVGAVAVAEPPVVPVQPVAPPAAVAPAEQLYEVVTEQWGSQSPVYYKGNTFVASMLPPTRDLNWALEQLVVAKIPPTDPRSLLPPTGPTGDQTGTPTDGWASTLNPQRIEPQSLPGLIAAMQANGATPAMINAVRAQVGRLIPVPAPTLPSTAPGT